MKIIDGLRSTLPRPHLSDSQYIYFASVFKTTGEAVVIGASAAFFLPETLQLNTPILFNRFIQFFITGLIILFIGAIFEKRGKHD